MRRSIVRHGDSTTTHGRVIAFDSSMFDEGKRIALHGEHATCGNCNGTFKIIGSGIDFTENGRAAVLHGDRVLCPCGNNKVIAGSDAGCHVEEDGDSSRIDRASATSTVRTPSFATATYDDRFVLHDAHGHALAHAAYGIQRENGIFEYGETDDHGQTHLLAAIAFAERIKIYLAG